MATPICWPKLEREVDFKVPACKKLHFVAQHMSCRKSRCVIGLREIGDSGTWPVLLCQDLHCQSFTTRWNPQEQIDSAFSLRRHCGRSKDSLFSRWESEAMPIGSCRTTAAVMSPSI